MFWYDTLNLSNAIIFLMIFKSMAARNKRNKNKQTQFSPNNQRDSCDTTIVSRILRKNTRETVKLNSVRVTTQINEVDEPLFQPQIDRMKEELD